MKSSRDIVSDMEHIATSGKSKVMHKHAYEEQLERRWKKSEEIK